MSGSCKTWLLAAAIALVPHVALAEYKLQPGDVLDVLIMGIPDFKQHALIGIEGNIGLPLGGQITVGGLSVKEARTRIAAELSNKQYRQYASDGHEVSHLIIGSEVVVEVSEYTPVFVDGDISKPGAYPFRPGMTVRQAIAVAGGYSPVRLPGSAPALQAAQLQAQYNTLMTQYTGEQARASRLKTELGITDAQQNDLNVPAGGADPITQGEAEQLAARKAERGSRKASLQDAITKATLQLKLLAEKKSQDEMGNQADQADYNSVRELFQKGLAPSSRLTETRRAALLSSVQVLQTFTEISNVERQRDEYTRQLDQIDTLGRVENLQDLQKANLRMAEIRATLKGIADSLALVGRLRAQPDQRVHLTVFRKGVKDVQRTVADEDQELAPGDVVKAVLPHDTAPDRFASSAITR